MNRMTDSARSLATGTKRRTHLLAALVPTGLVAGLLAGTAPLAAAAPIPAAECPSVQSLGAAANYSGFAFGSATRGGPGSSDIEGNAAYGGSASFDNFYVGLYSGSPRALVVGGSV